MARPTRGSSTKDDSNRRPAKRPSRSRAGEAGHRSLAEYLQRLLARGVDVSDLRTGRSQGTGGAARRKELPALPDTPGLPQAGDSRPARDLPGYAPDDGNRHAAPRHTERHPRRITPASIKTTGDVYVQILDESVARAASSRTAAVLGD